MKYFLLFLIFILLSVILALWESMYLWNSHPRVLVCTVSDSSCKLISYEYKHQICWSYIIHSKHAVNSCRIPKYKDKELNLFPFYSINDSVVKENNSSFDLYLVDKSLNELYMASFKTKERADFVSTNLNAHIKKWQEDSSYFDYSEKTKYSYDFFED